MYGNEITGNVRKKKVQLVYYISTLHTHSISLTKKFDIKMKLFYVVSY